MLSLGASSSFADQVLMPCTALSVKVDKDSPTFATFSLKCAPTTGVFQIPFGANSPVDNGFGASISLYDLGSNLIITTPSILSSVYWKALGDPPGIKGYRYRDVGTCKSIKLDSKGLKMKCRAFLFAGTLPAMGEIAIRMLVGGTPQLEYCAQLGGDETRNDERMLKRKNAPAPVTCLAP